MEKRLRRRWVKSRNLNPEGCAGDRFWVQGEGPLLSWQVNPALAGPGLKTQIPAARVDVLAGLD